MSLQENRSFPNVITSAFGRIFYGAPNRVMFSSVVIDDIGVLGKCYQRNDPTSSENPDILATDGGEINIQDAGQVIALEEFSTGVLIFAQYGIWFLSGPEGGFTALDYTLKRVTTYNMIGPRAKVRIGSSILFASDLGFHSISLNEMGEITEELITEQTVDSLVRGFIKYNTYGYYDKDKKQVIWTDGDSNRFLIFDIRLNAWFPQAHTGGTKISSSMFDIYRDLYYVVKDSAANQIRFSQFTDTAFKDYGVPFDSYLVTNYDTGGNFTRYKGIPIFSAYFMKTETVITGYSGGVYQYDKPSGCLVSVRWDWNTSSTGGKWTQPVQMYKPIPRRYVPDTIPVSFDTGESVISSKSKFRGKGRAIQIKFQSEPSKDMKVLGYSFEMTSKGRQ